MTLRRKIKRIWTQEDVRRALELYLVTDNRWLEGRSLATCVADALVGGVSFVQLRVKGASTIALAKYARALAPVCRVANVPLVINDDIEAAKVASVDGVHIGQDDGACAYARKELGADAIVGVSVHTVSEAEAAERDGATYIGVGAVASTSTKEEADVLSFQNIRDICNAVSIPAVAIGGITVDNVCELKGSGIAGIAVVSAIMAANNIEKASKQLKDEVGKIV